MPPSLVSCFSAFIVDETCYLFVAMLSRFEVTHFWLRAGRLKFGEFGVFPAKFFRRGVKRFRMQVFKFQAWPHTKLVCKFRGDPLRGGWDPLSTILGPKLTDWPTDTGIQKKVLSKNRRLKKSSAVAEMGDCLATTDMGWKLVAVPPFLAELDPHLTHRMGRGIPPRQVAV